VAGTKWFVVVEQDRDEAFAGSSRLARHLGIAVFLALLGAVGLSWVLASYLSAPIHRLSEAAEALSEGDFGKALAVGGRPRSDEIGALDRAFHHMAEQIQQQHRRLQERIGLTEEELRKSEEKLKRTLEAAARSERLVALGRLASGVAHEIRTPLASLKLFLQSIEEEWQGLPEHAEDHRMAMRQVRRIESTINHFLDFARPREPSLAEIDFVRLVDDALVVVQPRANQQEVEVVRSVAADLPRVEGDSRQLVEAIVNLLVNALDVMPEGGRLSIAVARDADRPDGRGQRVRIDVSDTGPGFGAGDSERLFEPFFTTKAAGSGLGLAIVRGTVERHGGTVQVNSRPGEGAVFSIFLPEAGTCRPY
jgi:signal transduction histidine kinase